MGNDGGDLFLCHAVRLRVLKVIGQGGIRDPGSHQGYDGDDALCLYVDCFFIPYLSEEHVIIQMREHRREISQLVSACGLYDLLSHYQNSSLSDLLVSCGPDVFFFCGGRFVLCHNACQRMRDIGLLQIEDLFRS